MLKNNKIMIKKSIFLMILVLVVVICFSSIINNTKVSSNTPKNNIIRTSTFTNPFFNTNLSFEDKAEVFVKYNDIHTIIENAMNTTYPSNEERDLAMKDAVANLVGLKRVSINSAEDLYHFSVDVAYNWKHQATVNNYPYLKTIKLLLSLNYVLLSDIDYSVIRAKKFIPIGIDLIIPETEPIVYHYPFTGSFDGQGFIISNLYLADYSYVSMTYRFDDDETTDVDLPISSHYSMFTVLGETAKICNLMLVNPIFELLDAPEGLTDTSILVGANNGLIYNVSVIDTRVNSLGEDLSGIRFNVQFGSSSNLHFTAAGFVHTNLANGKIYNSFYVSKNVMAIGSKNRFDVKPFIYDNQGTIVGVAYDKIVENAVDSTNQPIGVTAYTTEELQTGFASENPININSVDLYSLVFNNLVLYEKRSWHYYEQDGYPSLLGLDYNDINNYFEIKDEYDLIVFSKLIKLNTTYNNIPYNRHTYYLVDDIDMKNITTYQTPSKEFRGVLKGGDDDFTTTSETNTNKYIANLRISRPFVIGNEYYLGLFGILNGTVQNINFFQCNVRVENISNYYGRTFYVGLVAANFQNGIIKNIISNSTIDLGTEALGKTYAGGIIGYGNGSISFVANKGLVNGNNHDFAGLTINASYFLGGIAGGSSEENLEIHHALNTGSIIGIGSTSNYKVATGENVLIKIGGIIGQVNNQTVKGNSLVYVTNSGTISSGEFIGTSSSKVYQYLGGIFGDTMGFANKITESDKSTIRNGRWENNGNVIANYTNTFTYYYTAGIGVASTTSAKAEFSYMINSGGYSFGDHFNIGTHNIYIYYAATIIDNSSGGIRLSRAYNEKNYLYDGSYFVNSKSLPLTTINIAPFFTTITNIGSELLYCQNNGNITVGNTTSYTAIPVEMKVAGMTLASKVNYRNVFVTSNITLTKITQNANVYVAGIAWVLPYDTNQRKAYYAFDCLNEGIITTADFNGNTDLSNISGTEQKDNTFSSTLVSRNIYVAGLFNINVGNIDNSINRGDITSTDSNSNVKDITGTGNTYVGGIATFNYNHIQDCANLGNIEYTNSNTNSITYVSGGTNPGYNSQYGGLIFAFKGGLTLGGVVSAFGDTAALVLDGYGKGAEVIAEIIDSSNNGNVYGKAKEYVRSGGILGVALGAELTSGTDSNTSNGKIAVFSTSIIGAGDKIANCILSNGLNFGNIYAITNIYGQYPGTVGTSGNSEGLANSQRPGIYSCSGGVIGYGLCKMKRMLNHGIILATDVAGGIVGATYILGTTDNSNIAITIVDIDTAVHYGRVKAVRTSQYSNINYLLIENILQNDINNITYLYGDGDDEFIFPKEGGYNLSLYPNRKRGFGGIFGRLQRGAYGLMQSTNFINIMNMDPNVDMVGRADQSSYGSLIYFRFSVEGVEDTYYTARTNDTTPACLVGHISATTTDRTYESSDQVVFRIKRTGWFSYTYYVNQLIISNGAGTYTLTDTRNVGIYLDKRPLAYSDVNNNPQKFIVNESGSFTNYNETTPQKDEALSKYGLTEADVSGLNYSNNYAYTEPYSNYANFSTSIVESTIKQYKIEKITDNPTNLNATYIFDDSFPLMDSNQSNYIYKVDNPVLADRFREPTSPNYREYGMYVLATTQGRETGAVLPANLRIDNLYKLNEEEFKYLDLENVPPESLMKTGSDVETLLEDYKSMFQIRFNDKSLILPHETNSSLGDIVLYDPSGNSPLLQGGIIDNENHTVTFTLSKDAFSQLNVSYQVFSANLSNNAVIAISGITANEHSGFKLAYENRITNILTGDYAPTISGVVVVGNQLIFNEKITVYSEIAANVSGLVTTYFTDYTIIIDCTSSEFAITFDNIIMDGNMATIPSEVNRTYTITSHLLSSSGTIEIYFNDAQNQLPFGHLITFSGLFLGTTEIDSAYYSSEIYPLDANSLFGFSVSLSNQLQAGTYTIKYRYYNNIDEYSIVFTKDSSGEYQVTDVSYDTYSSDASGNNTILPPTASNFMTYIEFGIDILGIPYYPNTVSATINEVNIASSFTYINLTSHYEILINDHLFETISISPFATLDSVNAYYNYNEAGIRYYVFDYLISDEKDIQHTITHTIVERELPNIIVYKNGNREYDSNILVAREDLLTTLYVDFGFYISKLNNNVSTNITKGGSPYLPAENEISFNAYTYYEIAITSLLETGIKVYNFIYNREAGITMQLGSITVEKLLGTNAYLKNINFQIGSDITMIYPTIYEVDSTGNQITSSFDILTYYGGIDYDGADLARKKYFRIDGKVSDIDLEVYAPEFILPIGAKIYRYDKTNSLWTDDVNGNFIGEESDTEAVVLYKIVSEDGSDEVYYYITAVDILYILTIRFKIYYQFSNGTIINAADSTSPIKNSVVVIAVKNYGLKKKDEDGNPIEYLPVTDEFGHTTYPFEEEGITNYIESLNNHATMFYFPTLFSNYIYTFGRNLSGCYGFSVATPLYNGQSSGDLVKGQRYAYSIHLKTGATGEGEYPWANDNYILPEIDVTGRHTGKYFYIVGSLKQIIREFAIVIHEETVGSQWGLEDDYTSWDQLP